MYEKNPISVVFLKARHEATLDLISQPPASILDIGCDDGEFLRVLAERYPDAELYGCDRDGETIKHARRACPKATLLEGDFMDLEFPPVDMITMLELLEHVDAPERMIEKTRSNLIRGGHLLLSIPRSEKRLWRAIWWAWENTLGRRWHGDHRETTEEQIEEMAKRAGFRLERKKRFFFGCISILLFRLPTD